MTRRRPASRNVVNDRSDTEKTAPPRLQRFEAWLTSNSIHMLRVSLGVIVFAFGVLKFFPGVSPAENLAMTTIHLMTFGLVPDMVAMAGIATVECFIGLSLIIRRGLRATIYLLVLWVIGILAPIVLLSERLFSGPYNAPTLEGQYILKDVILFTASLVIATTLYRSMNAAERQFARDEGR